MAKRLILAFLACLFGLASAAQDSEKNRGSLSGFHSGNLPGDNGLQINYRVSFRIWSLMNEPVYDVKFTWSFDERARLSEAPVGKGLFGWGVEADTPVGGLIKDMDRSEAESIRPYDVMVRIRGHMQGNPQRRYVVIWDVGVPGSSGKPSYNTPASPRWENLFQTPLLNTVSANEAKQVLKAGFIANAVEIVRISWRTDDYFRAQRRKFPPGKRAALRRAAERHIDLIANMQRLDRVKLDRHLQQVLQRAEDRRKKGDPAFLNELERFVGKLDANLPASFRNGGLEAEYRKARADIRHAYQKSLEEAQRALRRNIAYVSSYEQWEKTKRAELASRKKIASVNSGNYGGMWQLRAVNMIHRPKQLSPVQIAKRYCKVNRKNLGILSFNCRPGECTIAFKEDKTYVAMFRGDNGTCQISGRYEYNADNKPIARSQDGCLRLTISDYKEKPTESERINITETRPRNLSIAERRADQWTCHQAPDESFYGATKEFGRFSETRAFLSR